MFLQSEIIVLCFNCSYISIIDDIKYFHQFLMRRKNREKFIFVTHKQKTFNVMFFDFKNSSSYVQKQFDIMLHPYQAFVHVYLNNIVIFFRIFGKHCEHLSQIFKLFKQKKIMFAFKKSFISFSSITLLDQKIDSLEMSTADDKIKAMLFLSFLLIFKKLDYFFGFIN